MDYTPALKQVVELAAQLSLEERIELIPESSLEETRTHLPLELLPVTLGPWPENFSLRREELYNTLAY